MVDKTYTHIALVVDNSGSMHTIKTDMEGALKTFLKEQAKLPGKCLVDLVKFHSTVHTVYQDMAVDSAFAKIDPEQMTALYDGIGITTAQLGKKFKSMVESERPSTVIIVVVTDGMENMSKEYTADMVKKIVTVQQEEFDWKFVFLGANIDSFAVGGNLGFSRGTTMNYDANRDGTISMAASASAYVTSVRGGQRDATIKPEEKGA